jgi:excinuclease ABC subunit C
MMVDGGKGQLSIAKEVLDHHGVGNQSVIGLAKRLEEVFVPGRSEPLSISKTSPALSLLKRVRDEAHRFAISYHRKLRSKRTVTSELDQIPGVGESRRTILLKHFGSVKKIRVATVEEISAVKGIPKNIAKKIFEYFRQK